MSETHNTGIAGEFWSIAQHMEGQKSLNPSNSSPTLQNMWTQCSEPEKYFHQLLVLEV